MSRSDAVLRRCAVALLLAGCVQATGEGTGTRAAPSSTGGGASGSGMTASSGGGTTAAASTGSGGGGVSSSAGATGGTGTTGSGAGSSGGVTGTTSAGSSGGASSSGGCAASGSCTPANPCEVGALTCDAGRPTCIDTGTPVTDGKACSGSAWICCGGSCTYPQTDPSNCGACGVLATGPCTPRNVCDQGARSCQGGQPICVDTGAALPDGTTCGDAGSCCGGACAELASDPSNCGACGSVCPPEPPGFTFVPGWDACQDEHCQQALLFDPGLGSFATDGTTLCDLEPTALGGIPTCTTGDGGTTHSDGGWGGLAGLSLAVQDGWVYWATVANTPDGGAIEKAPVAGGAPMVLAAGPNIVLPVALAVDATSVYWVDQELGTAQSVPLDGGVPVLLASGLGFPGALSLHGQTLYVATWPANFYGPDAGSVLALPLDGGGPTVLAAGVGIGEIYWTSVNVVLAYPSSIRVYEALFTTNRSAAYWVDLGGGLSSVPLSGGTPSVLATIPNCAGFRACYAMAADDQSVYALTNQSDLWKVDLDGGAVTRILWNVYLPGPASLVVGPDAVYTGVFDAWIGRVTPK